MSLSEDLVGSVVRDPSTRIAPDAGTACPIVIPDTGDDPLWPAQPGD